MTKDSEHLQWIHDRLWNLAGNKNENADYMIRLREIIRRVQQAEKVLNFGVKPDARLDKDAEASRLDAESLRQRVPPVKP